MSFLNREIRDGYTILPEIKKFWAVELDLLERFIAVCKDRGFTYYAMFGTMLGAVRHKGFIPWDDDIDVVMPRADYDRLKSMPELFGTPYFLQTPENDSAACPRYMKLCNSRTAHIPGRWPDVMTKGGNMGISIDILPLDDVRSPLAAKRQKRKAAKCQELRRLRAAIDENGWERTPEWKRKRCVKARGFSYEELTVRYHEICSRYARTENSAKYCAVVVAEGSHSGLCFSKTDFSEPVYMDFEYLKIAVPNGYKQLIDIIYGDGMALPEISERKPSHEGIVSVDTPYTVFTAPFTDVFEGIGEKRVFLFGAGDSLRVFMRRYGGYVRPECTFDNDKKKWGTLIHGVPVKAPKELLSLYDSDSVVIIVSLYHKSIGEQLCEMGICDYRVFIDGWNYKI